MTPWTLSSSVRAVVVVPALLALGGPAAAQIVVEGLEDKEVYSDRVSFRIVEAAGYDYTAVLRGEPVAVERSVPVGVPVEVTDPKEYYDLTVERTNRTSGAKETLVIQFIIRASERADTEWGLPPFTPYPSIPSAAAEFAGSTLTVVAPAAFPLGLEIPVIALVRDGAGKRVGVNGLVRAPGHEDRPIELFRGVGSGTIPAATSAGTIEYAPSIHGVGARKDIAIEESTSWTSVSGNIAASTDWGADARIRVTGNVTVAAAATLTIRSGSVIRLAPSTTIEVTGSLVVEGSLERPVVFTAESRSTPWGGLLFRAGTSRGDVTGAIFARSGADPRWFDNVSGSGSSHKREQPCVYLSNGARVTLTDSFLVDGAGQAAHGEGSTFTMTRCLVQKFTTTGQFNGGTVTLTDSAFIEFPSAGAPFADADNDAMYLGSGTRTVTGCLIGWTGDDGIDGGGGATGPMFLTGCWFEGTYHEGFALTDNGDRTFRDCVAINCGQGFESGYGGSDGDVQRCLLTANLVGLRYGDNYDWDYTNTIAMSSSLSLFNARDVWGRAWDDWTHHLSRMDIRDNYLSLADPIYPDNLVWDPVADASRLAPFLPTPATSVGIGIALWDTELETSDLEAGVPVRLSTFTTVPVSVDYAVATDLGLAEEGTLEFVPGESLKTLLPRTPGLAERDWVRVTLSDPVNGELTGLAQARFVRIETVTLVAKGSRWKYWDQGTDLGTAWRAPGFADLSWPEGPAELGHGDDDEATDIEIGPSDDRFPTIYFRARFELADPSWVQSLSVQLKRDDGAVVYLNGEEVLRQNMPAGTIAYGTWSAGVVSGTGEAAFYPDEIDPARLVAGTNVLAVEVHQSDAGSSDVSFDMELVAKGAAATTIRFVRSDANGDERADVSDAVSILLVLFGGETSTCGDALDSDDSGVLDITDAIYLLRFLFLGGPTVPPPYPLPGEDPTADGLGCDG